MDFFLLSEKILIRHLEWHALTRQDLPLQWQDVETFVIKIPNLRPTRMGTFQKKSEAGSNIASMSVSNFRGRREVIFTDFVTHLFSVVYKQRPFHRLAVEPRRACRKGLTGLQRGPYGITTGPPLHRNNSPVAPSGGPYGRKTAVFRDKNRCLKMMKICVPEKP